MSRTYIWTPKPKSKNRILQILASYFSEIFARIFREYRAIFSSLCDKSAQKTHVMTSESA